MAVMYFSSYIVHSRVLYLRVVGHLFLALYNYILFFVWNSVFCLHLLDLCLLLIHFAVNFLYYLTILIFLLTIGMLLL